MGGHLGIGTQFGIGSLLGIGSGTGWSYSPLNQVVQSLQALNYQLQQLQQIEYVQQAQRQQQLQQIQYLVQVVPQQIQQLQQQLVAQAPLGQAFGQLPFNQFGFGIGQPLSTAFGAPLQTPLPFGAPQLFSQQPAQVM